MIDFNLTKNELETIQWGMHHAPKAEVRQRATAIHMLHQGQTPQEVAQLLAISQSTVYGWHERWRTGGLAGLANRPKSGRPKNADAAYEALLGEVVENAPSVYGYAFGVWTVDRLREHMRQQTGISLSNRRFRALMKALGYVARRPKHDVKALQDGDEVAQAKPLLDWLKKDASAEPLSSSLWTKPR